MHSRSRAERAAGTPVGGISVLSIANLVSDMFAKSSPDKTMPPVA
jgi:hypothetical protein